jgi:hypothetical protein
MKPTPDEIVAAFRKLNLSPVFRRWGNGRTTACGLTAIAVLRKGIIPSSGEEAAAILGVSDDFIDGFLDGWDRNGFQPPPTVESLGEYEEGIALAQETIYLLRKAGYDL